MDDNICLPAKETSGRQTRTGNRLCAETSFLCCVYIEIPSKAFKVSNYYYIALEVVGRLECAVPINMSGVNYMPRA